MQVQSRSSTPATMRTRLVPLLFEFMRHSGIDPLPVGERSGLTPSDIESKTLRLQVSTVASIAADVADAFEDPHIGLEMATKAPRGLYGVVEFAARNSPTVFEAMRRVVRYQNLLEDLARITWEERPYGVVLEHRLPTEREATGPQGNEFTLALFLRILDELVETPVVPERIWFAHNEKPRSLERLEKHFRTTRIDFGLGSNGMLLKTELCQQPVRAADPSLLSVLDEYARLLLPSTPNPSDPFDRLRASIRGELSSGSPSLENASKSMHMSVRTLQRRLEESGYTFSKLVDDVRSDVARQLLGDPRISVTEVAFMVGYTHPRAFLRAFRRWTGETPQSYRTRHMQSS